MRRLVGLLLVAAILPAAKLPEAIDGRRMLEDVKYLASERFKGRFTGTPELDEAARWIARNFQRAGLKPAFAAGNAKPSYLQKFVVTTESRLGRGNALKVGGRELSVARDWAPKVFSSNAQVAAPLVFAGYGITASEYRYDDYAGLDVKGRIAVVLRYEPQDEDENSVFEGKRRTRHSSLEAKATNAKLHGAMGLIIVNNAITYPEERETLDAFGGESGGLGAGIPVVQVKASLAEEWFRESQHDLRGIVRAIDRLLAPQSFRFPDTLRAELTVNIDRVMQPTHNVAAYLPGLTNEYIVIGAHYDHLGFGKQFSMAPSEVPKLHPGADDNGSGTAAVIEMARYFAKLPRLKRGILFVTFTGEEIGLLGSSHFVANPPLPLENCAAMINMDMVGRMVDGKFFVAGLGTGSNLKEVVDGVLAGEASLKPDLSENLNIGGSDHSSFSAKQVPALLFFSGLHSDYHKPSDTWDKIQPEPYAQLVRVIAATAAELASVDQRTEFRRVAAPPAAAGGSAPASGYGPYFGSVPDFAEVPGGVRLAEIRAGSPAEKAGLQGGDILTEFDGKKVDNLQDYTYVLRAKQPGDVVEVKVKRLDATLTFRVVLEARK